MTYLLLTNIWSVCNFCQNTDIVITYDDLIGTTSKALHICTSKVRLNLTLFVSMLLMWMTYTPLILILNLMYL